MVIVQDGDVSGGVGEAPGGEHDVIACGLGHATTAKDAVELLHAQLRAAHLVHRQRHPASAGKSGVEAGVRFWGEKKFGGPKKF